MKSFLLFMGITLTGISIGFLIPGGVKELLTNKAYYIYNVGLIFILAWGHMK